MPDAPAPACDDRGLLDVARASLLCGARTGRALVPDPADHPEPWREIGATFVTLREPEGALRGCIGSLEATRPLVVDTAENAYRAGFTDPRFAALREEEVASVRIHIALLSPLEPLRVGSEDELVAALRPGVDGLVLAEGRFRATFLPAVWEGLDDPRAFVRELQRKAGLPEGRWTAATEALRYTTRSIG